MPKQIKSKERVAEHGEVFTNEREVNAMLDLVKSETDRIESRFLEPACGDGNFLAEILRRKLARVKRQYKKNNSEYTKNAFLALTSIYGIDRKTMSRNAANGYSRSGTKPIQSRSRRKPATKYAVQQGTFCRRTSCAVMRSRSCKMTVRRSSFLNGTSQLVTGCGGGTSRSMH